MQTPSPIQIINFTKNTKEHCVCVIKGKDHLKNIDVLKEHRRQNVRSKNTDWWQTGTSKTYVQWDLHLDSQYQFWVHCPFKKWMDFAHFRTRPCFLGFLPLYEVSWGSVHYFLSYRASSRTNTQTHRHTGKMKT